jgi:uncharacterized protein (TIGR02996 family)
MPDLDPYLLRAVLADPADDDTRMVAADWLEEHGDPARAEFIRVQVELAELQAVRGMADPEKTYTGRKLLATLRRREQELAEKYGHAWVAEMLKIQ